MYLTKTMSSINALVEGVCFTIQFLAVQCSKRSSSRHQESRAECYCNILGWNDFWGSIFFRLLNMQSHEAWPKDYNSNILADLADHKNLAELTFIFAFILAIMYFYHELSFHTSINNLKMTSDWPNESIFLRTFIISGLLSIEIWKFLIQFHTLVSTHSDRMFDLRAATISEIFSCGQFAFSISGHKFPFFSYITLQLRTW